MKISTFAKLGDICDVAAGQGAPQGDSNYCDNGTPFVKAGNLIELLQGKSETDIQKVSEDVAKKHKLKKYPAGSILFAKSGMSCMKGYVYQLKNDCYVVSHLAIVKPKKDSSDYIEYCLRHIKPNSLVKDEAYPSISLQDISNLQIPLPSLEEQIHISEQLDKCTQIINKHTKELEKYDTLIKSRFIEMFGEPSKNPMNWKKCSVIEEADCMVPGRDKPKSFTGNIPWITIDDLNVLNKTFKSKKGLGLTSEEIDEVKREPIPEGSVIMSCVGNLGICSIAAVPMIINQQLHSFQCKHNLIPEFLMYCLTYQKSYMEMKANFTTVAYMNKTICNSIPIIVPPIALQNDFAAFVQQIDKSKF